VKNQPCKKIAFWLDMGPPDQRALIFPRRFFCFRECEVHTHLEGSKEELHGVQYVLKEKKL
jgi:hypothetical protein